MMGGQCAVLRLVGSSLSDQKQNSNMTARGQIYRIPQNVFLVLK